MWTAGGAIAVLAACGHVIRAGGGPTVRDDGKLGAQAGFEIGSHLLASPAVSMPSTLRAQAGWCDGGATFLLALGVSADFGPGFWHERVEGRRGSGFAVRVGGAGGAAYDRGFAGAARFGLAVGHGTVEPTGADGPMRVQHEGVELAWQPMFDRDGVARWSAAAELYWQLSHVPDESIAASLGVTK